MKVPVFTVLPCLISSCLLSICAEDTVDRLQVNHESKSEAAVTDSDNELHYVIDTPLPADTSGFHDDLPTTLSTVAFSDLHIVKQSTGLQDSMQEDRPGEGSMLHYDTTESKSDDLTVPKNQHYSSISTSGSRKRISELMQIETSEKATDSSTSSHDTTFRPNELNFKPHGDENKFSEVNENEVEKQESPRLELWSPSNYKDGFDLKEGQSHPSQTRGEAKATKDRQSVSWHKNVDKKKMDSSLEADRSVGRYTNGDDETKLKESIFSSGHRAYFPPTDYFKCGQCACHKLSNGNVYVNCRLASSRKFIEIPENLPLKMEYFDLSRNLIRFFGFVTFAKYPLLSNIIMSENENEIIKNCTCIEKLPNIRVLDLKSNKIRLVQDNSFSCLPNLKTLNLQGNRLKQLSKLTFSGLEDLEYLDVSNNQLEAIAADTFQTCSHLLTLKLDGNIKLTYGKANLVPELFRPLTYLRELHIQGFHVSSYSYPILALKKLVSLETLYVDGVTDGHFDDDLAVLRNLTTVNVGIGGYCVMKNLPKSYFRGLPFVTTIRIYGCHFNTISPQAFDSNKLLTDLNFTHVSYDFDSMFKSLCWIQGMPITALTLSHLIKGLKRNPCRYLKAENAVCLKNLTRLEKLSLDNNLIAYIDYGFLSRLPDNLKHLSLSKNSLSYLQSVVDRYNVPQLHNLEVLNEDLQYHGNILGRYDNLESDAQSCKLPVPKVITDIAPAYPEDNSKPIDLKLKQVSRVLPKLKVYSAVQSFNFGRQFLSSRRKKNKVKSYNVSNSFITDWGNKVLSPWIEIADVSNNFCDVLSVSFFKIKNNLKEFHARGNFLGTELANDFHGNKLSRLSKLEFLDFSVNHINELPVAVFKDLKSIKIIDLSNNNIKSFNVTMFHMTSLVFLNLKKNSITWISRETRNDMDALPNVTIDLTSNPLPCTCEGLELLIWLATTRVKLISQDYLQCEDETKNTRNIGDLKMAVATLQRQCASKAFLVLAASFSAVAFLLIASAVWIFRNRWWLYYMKNTMITKMFGYKAEDRDQTQQYWYDAYIHYGKQDAGFVMGECLQELEVKRGHKLCVEHRDFVLGSIMPCTITSAISRSRLTVPVITPEFWGGEWSEYGVQMAMMESIHTKRDVLHLLIYRPVDLEDMPRNLLKIHNDNAFSEYPPEDCREDMKKAFWDAMSRAIGHTKPPPPEPDE